MSKRLEKLAHKRQALSDITKDKQNNIANANHTYAAKEWLINNDLVFLYIYGLTKYGETTFIIRVAQGSRVTDAEYKAIKAKLKSAPFKFTLEE